MSSRPDPIDERQFTLAIQTLADTVSLGSDASPFRGAGGDYVQSRAYLPGDPVRSIDWRVTARTGRTHVKERESLRHKPVMLVVDRSASMFVRSVPTTKFAWAATLAGALGLAALSRPSPVGLFVTGGPGGVRQPPSQSRDAVMRWSTALRTMRPADPASLAGTLRELDAAARERCLLLVLSDLHEAEAVPALKRVAARHEVAVLRLQDPAELRAPAHGFFRGREAEGGGRFLAGAGASMLTRDDAAAALRRAAVETITLRTDANFIPTLRSFLADRGHVA